MDANAWYLEQFGHAAVVDCAPACWLLARDRGWPVAVSLREGAARGDACVGHAGTPALHYRAAILVSLCSAILVLIWSYRAVAAQIFRRRRLVIFHPGRGRPPEEPGVPSGAGWGCRCPFGSPIGGVSRSPLDIRVTVRLGGRRRPPGRPVSKSGPRRHRPPSNTDPGTRRA